MDQNRLATAIRWMTHGPSRRDVLRGLTAAGLALGLWRVPDLAGAKKKRKRRRQRKKKAKVTFNDFGCVDVGSFCKDSEQCCSGICEGKKGKKTCLAHDTGGCTGELDACAGDFVSCVTATDKHGICARTTGNAGYCLVLAFGFCAACTRDTDCQAMCGPQAACIVCEGECEPNGTGCAGPSGVSCDFSLGSAPSPSTGAAPARITRNRSR